MKKWPVRLTVKARRDVPKAALWYESQTTGLARLFLLAVDEAMATVAERPGSFAKIYRELRREIVPGFPYGVFFRQTDTEIVVVGIINLRRNPNTWKRRHVDD
jgi:plasmid stabilization system protein ParE